MDIVFTDLSTPCNSSDVWSVSCDRLQLLATLRRASERSAQLGHAILASFTLSVEPCDPLRVFLAFQSLPLGDRFFWALPSEQRAHVGVGIATTLETHGTTRFADAAVASREMYHDSVRNTVPDSLPDSIRGPLLFGGFTFDSQHTRTDLWKGFPDGLLVLPRLHFSTHEGQAALTINTLVQPSDDIEYCADVIIANIERLRAIVERIPARLPPEITGTTTQLAVQDLLPAHSWKELVAATVQKIQRGIYQKVVLARGVQAISETGQFDVNATLFRLRESYPEAYVFAIQRGARYFVGATPERLLRTSHGQVLTMALAGSAPRGATEEEDQRLRLELLQSEKNKGEHNIVVAMIRDALAPLCSQIWVADTPELFRLKNIQHLKTPIIGELLPDRCALEAIQELHPTPAVGGFPRDAALAEIRDHEGLDRGWYAGPVGWINANGNGEFAVALRSALIEGNTATLFAGCGIVADSDPESEYAESCWKLKVMLRGLGGED